MGRAAITTKSGTTPKTWRQPHSWVTWPAIAGPTSEGRTHANEKDAKNEGR